MVEPVRWQCGKDDEDEPAMGPARLAEEREKHRKRSERFGIEFRDVGHRRDLRDEARKERLARPGFVTGMDLFSEEAIEKRRKRAERFGTADNSEDMGPKLLELPEQERAKRRRAEKFGLEYLAPEATMGVDINAGLAVFHFGTARTIRSAATISNLQEERSDVPMEVPRRHDALHMYGVDLMSTADVLEYWSSYGPTYVEWINDSCCNVCFADQYTAVRAIVGMGAALPPDGTPDGQGGLTAMDVPQVAVLWHKGPDFVKDGVPVPLLFRLATIQDKKDLNRSIADIAKSRWARRRRPPRKASP